MLSHSTMCFRRYDVPVRWLPETHGHQLAAARARRAEVAPSASGVLALSALKLNLSEELLAWGVSKVDGPFACPECRSAVIEKKGDRIVHHFAHAPGSSCPTATRSSIAQVTPFSVSERCDGAVVDEEARRRRPRWRAPPRSSP